MQEVYHCNTADIHAAIGPSIGPCCYNVGGEVIDSLLRFFGTTEKYINFNATDSLPYFDLWYANKQQLLDAGLFEDHIEVAEICTKCNYNNFFSSRYGHGNTGRFGAGITLK